MKSGRIVESLGKMARNLYTASMLIKGDCLDISRNH